MAIGAARPRNEASPAVPRTSTICSVAYATEEIGSEQNTGSAIFFGSSVSPIRSLARARPMNTRLSRWVVADTGLLRVGELMAGLAGGCPYGQVSHHRSGRTTLVVSRAPLRRAALAKTPSAPAIQ